MNADGLEGLPLEARVLRYYEMSEDALRRAEQASNEAQREQLLAIAEEWRLLAEEGAKVLSELRQPKS